MNAFITTPVQVFDSAPKLNVEPSERVIENAPPLPLRELQDVKEEDDTEMFCVREPENDTIDPSPLLRMMLMKVLLSAIERDAELPPSSIKEEEEKVRLETSVATNRSVPLHTKREEAKEEVEVV